MIETERLVIEPPPMGKVQVYDIERVIANEGDFQNRISAIDVPGAGGACHRYQVSKGRNPLCSIKFQEGGIQDFGVNGCQNEDLLAIVIDRLECFQAGPYSCEENREALRLTAEALSWLRYRTSDRVSRGVEGTSKK